MIQALATFHGYPINNTAYIHLHQSYPRTCVISVVCFEMGRLEICLSALGVVTHERPLSFVNGWKLPLPPLSGAAAFQLGGRLDICDRFRRPRGRLWRGLQNDDGRQDDWGLGVGADDGRGGRDGRGWRMRPIYLLVDWGIIAKYRRGCWLHDGLWWHYHS